MVEMSGDKVVIGFEKKKNRMGRRGPPRVRDLLVVVPADVIAVRRERLLVKLAK
jgi:hypothetical protein